MSNASRDLMIGFGGSTYSLMGLFLSEWAALATFTYMTIKIVQEIYRAFKNRKEK